jgi:hypothetical protein
VATAKATLGREHPVTATLLDGLARILDTLGRDTDAAAVHERLPAATPSADDRSSAPSGPEPIPAAGVDVEAPAGPGGH